MGILLSAPPQPTRRGPQTAGWPHGRPSWETLPTSCCPNWPETPFHPSVLRRIKVTFLDTVVRVEHSPGDGERGVAVEIHVQR